MQNINNLLKRLGFVMSIIFVVVTFNAIFNSQSKGDTYQKYISLFGAGFVDNCDNNFLTSKEYEELNETTKKMYLKIGRATIHSIQDYGINACAKEMNLMNLTAAYEAAKGAWYPPSMSMTDLILGKFTPKLKSNCIKAVNLAKNFCPHIVNNHEMSFDITVETTIETHN